MNKISVKLSVALIAYNHEKYIIQALESVLAQKTHFDYEIVIGEDCSTDRTKDIVFEYQKKYPEKIRVLLNKINLGMHRNWEQTIAACNGEYVALLEGDDYWTDHYKLQKQTDFLDDHPDYSLCFHYVKVFNDNLQTFITSWEYVPTGSKRYYMTDDLLERGNFIPSSSVVFRKNLFCGFPPWFDKSRAVDYLFHMMCAQKGKLGYLDEFMGVYRIHAKGAYTGLTVAEKIETHITMYLLLDEHLGLRKRISFQAGLSRNYVRLCGAYRRNKMWSKAFSIGYKAVISAPYRKKLHAMFGILISKELF